MTLQDAMCTSASRAQVRLPDCPQCGDMLLAPLLAEHVSERVVRNHWVCETCGHAFRKSFKRDHRTETVGLV